MIFLRSFALLVILTLVSCKFFPSSTSEQLSDDAATKAKSYAELCQTAGVLIPNRPLTDRGFWISVQRSTKEHFGGLGKHADVYRSAIVNGAGCIMTVNNVAIEHAGDKFFRGRDTVLGICWSELGKVCFWEDNMAPPDHKTLVTKYILSEVPGAHTLSGSQACVACHRGENPFVNHGDGGEPAIADLPDVPFLEMVGRPDIDIGNVYPPKIQCAGACHQVSKPTSQYCRVAKNMLNAGLMNGKDIGLNPKFRIEGSYPDLDTCQKWNNFLVACELANEEERAAFERRAVNSSFIDNFKPDASALGACAPVLKI